MNKEFQEFFGEPIYTYTAQQAIEDGILMKNPSIEFEECTIITTNLWSYIQKKASETSLTEPIELLDIIMKKARKIYTKGRFHGDNDSNFFVINGNQQFKPVWFVRNEYNKLTGIRPEDY